ncbi:zinc finger FYVE domain-containing protein 21-like isoform X1 [Cimex lectularius]|uniref:FYVE-type domain-containing protein n=1 Tax=Cimex lectularius TaxID=79782 RepID=A0A8I6RP66_CIMLE|nr:zinc finger FYVE domain-containing protein 21-like isoform X1 [Cimex lectularius]
MLPFFNMEGKKLIKSKSGFRMVAVDETRTSPLFINEPLWTPDKEATNCRRCSVKFGFTTRKHHCRRCGFIYCNKCSERMLDLPRMCFIDPVRICLNCEEETKQENRFFQHDLKVLMNGALFILNNNKSSDLLLHCKLSLDHRTLVFEGSQLNPILLDEITYLCVETDQKSGKSNLEITYTEEGQVEKISFCTTKDIQERQAGNEWMKAMKQAFRFTTNKVRCSWDQNSSSSSLLSS